MSEPVDDLLDAAWLEGPTTIGEYSLRPFSLGTLLLATRFDLSLVWSGGAVIGLDKASLDGQLATYVWMQSSPLAEVLEAARDGTWEVVKRVNLSVSMTLAAVILSEIRRHKALIDAATFRVGGGKPGKAGQFLPGWFARKLHLLTFNRGWTAEYVIWHLPFAQAEQLEHCVMRGLGWDTYKKGSEVAVADKVAQVEAAARKAAETIDDEW